MADINSFSFTGRCGADAQIKKTPNGKTYMELSVAVSTGYGDYKKTLWIKVKQWGDRVNNVAPIFKKGSLVGGTGELSLETWSSKDGSPNASAIVTCMNVQILSSKKQEERTDEAVVEDVTF